jgi:carboxypeptidase Q
MKHPLIAAGLLALTFTGTGAQERDDALQLIRQEGLERSQAVALFDHLTTTIGPRLSGSPAYKEAVEWSKARLTEWGLANVRVEPFEFGRGWELQRLTVEMIEPRYMPLIAHAEAWSSSTAGDIVATPVFLGGRTAAEIGTMKDRLEGAIVMTQREASFIREDRPQPTDSETPVRIGQPPNPGPRQDRAEARQIAQLVRESGAAVILRTSAGEHGTMFVLGRDAGDNAIPTVVVAGEHYNLLARMLARGIPVKLRVNVQARFLTNDTNSYNVLADLPGTDPAVRDQIVMIGAHLDSWHTGTGATDNADGSAAVLEAMRILKTTDVRPRRTIRVALWGAEEQGLHGSRAYAKQHLAGSANNAERDRHFVYLNLDPGMGPIYGWYLENTDAIHAPFDRWLGPLKDLGMRRNIAQGIGATDHLAFREVGVPGFNPVQDYVDYDVRTHHTNMDTAERIREADLKQNAVVMAWFALQAANTTEGIPRVAPSASPSR